jgi:hypothetical protein
MKDLTLDYKEYSNNGVYKLQNLIDSLMEKKMNVKRIVKEYKNGQSRGWPACPKEFHISLVLGLSHSWLLHFPPTNTELILERVTQPNLIEIKLKLSIECFNEDFFFKAH